MRSPTLCLAALVAVLFAVSSSGMPVCDGDTQYVKATQSSSTSNSATSTSSSDEEVVQSNGCGQVFKESSHSSDQAACSSANKNQASYEAGNSKDGSFVKKDSSSQSVNAAAAASSKSHEKIIDSGSGKYSKESSKSATKAVASGANSNSESYEAHNGGGGSGSGGKSCGCNTKSITIEEIKKTYAQKSGESIETYYKRIISACSSLEEFEKIYSAYPNLDCWGNIKYFPLIKDCYTKIYAKKQCESDDDYFVRVFKRYTFETNEQYGSRLLMIQETYPNLKCWYDETYFPKYTETIYREVFKKTSADISDDTYFNRIMARRSGETDDVYVQRIYLIRNHCLPNLKLWQEEKYFDLLKDFYTKAYTKQEGECNETYYTRILRKDSCDTSTEIWSQKVHLIHMTCPNIPLWHEEKYYEKYSKKYIVAYYKKFAYEEKSETEYYKRITTKYSGESNSVYIGRMILVQRSFPDMPLWSDIKLFSLTKPYYSLRYAQKSGESEATYIERLFTKEGCDSSNEKYCSRMEMIRRVTPSCSVWYDEQYYDKYTKNVYSTYFQKYDTESCDGWLVRVFEVVEGESESNAIKRVGLIKKSTSSCGCWTSEHFSKVKCSSTISSDYLSLIKKTFFSTDVQYEKKSSSSSCCSSSASSSAADSEVVIKRAVC